MAMYTPLGSFSVNDAPLSNVTPFTYGDGFTYLTILQTLRSKIDDTITMLNTNNSALDAWRLTVNDAITAQNAAVDLLNTQVLQYTVLNNGNGTLTLHFPDGSSVIVYTQGQIDTLIGGVDSTTTALLLDNTSGTYAALQTDVAYFVANQGSVQTALTTLMQGVLSDSNTTVYAAVETLVRAMMGADAQVSSTLHDKVLGWITTSTDAIRLALQDFVGDVRVEWFGAKGDGVTDDSLAINAAIIACPSGGTVTLAGGKTYLVANPISNADGSGGLKSVNVRATGATILVSHNGQPFEFSGAYTDPVNVTGIAALTNYANGGASVIQNGYQLTLASIPTTTWKIGDVVRVVADNIIPGTRGSEDTSVSAQPRVGEFATVVSLSGSTLVVAGRFEDTFSSNIMVGRVSDLSCSWDGGTILYTDAAFSASNYTFKFSTLRNPTIKGVTIPRMNRGAIFLFEDYGWQATSCVIGYGIDNSGIGQYGYGVVNIASAYGVMSNCRFGQVRHGYTNGHSSINTASGAIAAHGRPCYNTVSDCHIDGATSSGVDSHSSGAYETFTNVSVANAQYGITLRGRNHQVNGAILSYCGQGVYIFDEEMGGQSWGHHLSDITMYYCPVGFGVWNGGRVGASNYQVRDTRAIHISNVVCNWVDGMILGCIYHTVFMNNVYAKFTNNTAVANKFFGIQNSTLRLNDSYIDGSAVPGSVQTPFIDMSSSDTVTSSIVDVMNVTLLAAQSLITYLLAGSDANCTVRARDFVLNNYPSAVKQSAFNGFVNWRLLDHQRNDLIRTYMAGSTALTSTTAVQIANTSATFFAEEGDTYEYNMTINFLKTDTTVEGVRAQLYVDGAWVSDLPMNIQGNSSFSLTGSLSDWLTNLTSGQHTISVWAKLDSGTSGWSIGWARLTLKRL